MLLKLHFHPIILLNNTYKFVIKHMPNDYQQSLMTSLMTHKVFSLKGGIFQTLMWLPMKSYFTSCF